MFSQIAIFYAVNDQDSLSQFEGYTDVVIDKYKELTDYMASLCERTEEIRNGKIDRKYDNMLKVSTDGRKATLDLTLVGAKQPYNESSKIYCCIQNVLDVYHRYEGCTQLIFCDYSTPKGEDFSVYKELKARLMEKESRTSKHEFGCIFNDRKTNDTFGDNPFWICLYSS